MAAMTNQRDPDHPRRRRKGRRRTESATKPQKTVIKGLPPLIKTINMNTKPTT